jgi:hypothetical protein
MLKLYGFVIDFRRLSKLTPALQLVLKEQTNNKPATNNKIAFNRGVLNSVH